jgi:hypothetical protein
MIIIPMFKRKNDDDKKPQIKIASLNGEKSLT